MINNLKTELLRKGESERSTFHEASVKSIDDLISGAENFGFPLSMKSETFPSYSFTNIKSIPEMIEVYRFLKKFNSHIITTKVTSEHLYQSVIIHYNLITIGKVETECFISDGIKTLSELIPEWEGNFENLLAADTKTILPRGITIVKEKKSLNIQTRSAIQNRYNIGINNISMLEYAAIILGLPDCQISYSIQNGSLDEKSIHSISKISDTTIYRKEFSQFIRSHKKIV